MASLEVARSHGIAKASWMQRQSEILSRWKYSFCVLYRNGKFNFYKDEKMTSQQGSINIPKSCYAVNVGAGISGSPTPPSGMDRDCLLELRSHEINVLFCADSVDDSVTWKSSIQEVKNSLLQPAQPPAAAQPHCMGPRPLILPSRPRCSKLCCRQSSRLLHPLSNMCRSAHSAGSRRPTPPTRHPPTRS